MFDLPLFPLHTVLFPGMPLQLRIFEERYKKMLRACIDERKEFGVVLIRHGSEAFGPLAEPYRIGCTARIVQVQPLKAGRMMLVALGQKRFRVLSLEERAQPFLVGRVELFPLEASDPQQLAETGRRLLPWVRRYMQLLSSASEVRLDPDHLPHDPVVLAYLGAVLLQVPAGQKQKLLSSERAGDLLAEVYALYRREVALLRRIVSQMQRESAGYISRN